MDHQNDEGNWRPEKGCVCHPCWYYGIGWKDCMMSMNELIFAKESSTMIKDMMENNEKEPYSSDEIIETMYQKLKELRNAKVD